MVLVLILLVAGMLGYYYYSTNLPIKTGAVTPPPVSQLNVTEEPTVPVVPTRSQEEIKRQAQIQDQYIDITKDGFTPASVEVKVNDQIFFTNKDTVAHKVKGENWGGILINPGENFIQSFKTSGTHTYTDEKNTALKGTIIVK